MIRCQKGSVILAKKKAKKNVDKEEPMAVISIKATVAFRDWLAMIAVAERSTVVQILEKGAVEYGEKRGFKDAPRRTKR
jgi:hypothetical protein